MALQDVPGQEYAARQLTGALKSDRLAHAYLFVGPVGVGRLRLARELAAILLCSASRKENEPCGHCRNCALFSSGNHPDYEEIAVPEGKQQIPIELVRHVQDAASLKPVAAARRVFVIRDAERMTPEAFNCFLKTLEEPPGACVFILLAASVREILPTVASRCQLVRLRNLPPQQVQASLEKDGLPGDDARWLARRSWGSAGLARSLKDADLHIFNRELVANLSRLQLSDNFRLTDWLLAEAAQRGDSRVTVRLALQELLECVAMYYRDLMMAAARGKDAGANNRDLPSAQRPAPSVDQLAALVERAEAILEAIERVGANANQRLALDSLFTQLALP